MAQLTSIQKIGQFLGLLLLIVLVVGIGGYFIVLPVLEDKGIDCSGIRQWVAEQLEWSNLETHSGKGMESLEDEIANAGDIPPESIVTEAPLIEMDETPLKTGMAEELAGEWQEASAVMEEAMESLPENLALQNTESAEMEEEHSEEFLENSEDDNIFGSFELLEE